MKRLFAVLFIFFSLVTYAVTMPPFPTAPPLTSSDIVGKWTQPCTGSLRSDGTCSDTAANVTGLTIGTNASLTVGNSVNATITDNFGSAAYVNTGTFAPAVGSNAITTVGTVSSGTWNAAIGANTTGFNTVNGSSILGSGNIVIPPQLKYDHVLIVDPSSPEVVGNNYQTFAHASDYAMTQNPGEFNTFAIQLSGTITEEIRSPYQYVYIKGSYGTTILTNVKPAPSGTSIFIDCFLINPDFSSATAVLYNCILYQGTFSTGLQNSQTIMYGGQIYESDFKVGENGAEITGFGVNVYSGKFKNLATFYNSYFLGCNLDGGKYYNCTADGSSSMSITTSDHLELYNSTFLGTLTALDPIGGLTIAFVKIERSYVEAITVGGYADFRTKNSSWGALSASPTVTWTKGDVTIAGLNTDTITGTKSFVAETIGSLTNITGVSLSGAAGANGSFDLDYTYGITRATNTVTGVTLSQQHGNGTYSLIHYARTSPMPVLSTITGVTITDFSGTENTRPLSFNFTNVTLQYDAGTPVDVSGGGSFVLTALAGQTITVSVSVGSLPVADALENVTVFEHRLSWAGGGVVDTPANGAYTLTGGMLETIVANVVYASLPVSGETDLITVASPTLAWDNGTPVAVTSTGDVWLEGATSDIYAFVTYASLPTSNQSDNLIAVVVGTKGLQFNSQIKIVGTDDGYTDPTGFQRNGIILDGAADTDKNLQWYDNGTPKWIAQTYRNEDGKFWYLANYGLGGGREPIVISESGQVGINKQSNMMNYHSTWMDPVAGNLDDMIVGGIYIKNFSTLYEIAITTADALDKFKWRKSVDNGANWSGQSSEIECATTATAIDNGVTALFGHTTGHNTNDKWQFTAFSQLPEGNFTIAPRGFVEINQVADITQETPSFLDYSDRLNFSSLTNPVPILSLGTDGALYIGDSVPFNSVFLNITTPAAGMTTVVEYWNGAWTAVNSLIDGTTNGTVSGRIAWDITNMSDWVKKMPEHNPADLGYDLYWVRITSSTSISTKPILSSIIPRGGSAFSVYSAHNDRTPTFDFNNQTFIAPNANLSGAVNVGGNIVVGGGLVATGLAGGGTQYMAVNNLGVVYGTGVDPGTSTGANANGYYLVNRATNAPANAINLGSLTTGLLKISVSGGVATPSTAGAGTDYQVPLPNVTNEAQIAKSIVTTKGDLVTSSGNATPTVFHAGASAGNLRTDGSGNWAIDTGTYITGNQTITLSGDTTGSGTTAITTTTAKATNLKGGNATTLLGAIPYQSGADTTSFINNVTTTRKFIRQVGNGTNSTQPAYDTLQSGDIPSNAANTSGTATTATNLGVGTIYQIPYQSGTGTTTFASAAASSVLVTNGSNVPSLSTTLPSGIAATNMALTTPSLGVATATSINSVPVGWTQTTGTFTAAPASTSTLTMTSDLTALIKARYPLMYVIGGVNYYGIVDSIIPNLLTVNGAPLGGNVTALYYGNPERVTEIVRDIPSTYEASSNASLINSILFSRLKWDKAKSYLVKYTMWSHTHDSTTHGTATVYVNSADVNSSAGGLTIAANATEYSTVVDINTSNYDINPGELIEIGATKNGAGDATYLVATMLFVTP